MFADPKTDFVFKRIFGATPSEASREASEAAALNTAETRTSPLIALLNNLLEFEGNLRVSKDSRSPKQAS